MVGHLEVFCRSLCLLQFLAFLRVLLCAIPLSRAAHRTNRRITVARFSLRGAPLALALAFCCVVVHAAPTAGGADAQAPSLVPLDATVAAAVARQSDPPADVSHAGPAVCTQRAVDDPSLSGTGLGVRHVAVQVLRIQSLPTFLSLRWSEVRQATVLVALAEEAIDAKGRGVQLVEVFPQPCSDTAVLLSVPTPCLQAGRCPVCIQCHVRDEMPHFWQEIVDNTVGLEEVRDLVGQDWSAQAQVYVSDSMRPLSTGESRPVSPGCLIRIVHKTSDVSKTRTLGVKLFQPEDNLRDPWDVGFPPDTYESHLYALLQLLEPTRRVQYSPIPNCHDLLDEVLVSHAASHWRPYDLCWPRDRVTDLLVRGRHVTLAAGVFPQSLTERVPLFVDGRPVGLPLRLYAAPQGNMPLHELLDMIGLFEPHADRLDIGGTADFDPEFRTLAVCAGDVLVLHYLSADEPGHLLQQPLTFASTSAEPEGCARDDPAVVGFSGGLPGVLHGSAENSLSGGPGTASHGAGAGAHLHGQLAVAADGSWPEAFPEERRRVRPDAATVILPLQMSDPNPHNCWPTEQVAPLEPPGETLDSPVGVDEGEESEAASDDAASSGRDSPIQPEEWRVPVMLLSYQTSPVYDALWVARDESASSWLARASILLVPPGGGHDILLPACQPVGRFLCLLCVPRWWKAERLHPVLVADVRYAGEAYVAVARIDDGPREFLSLGGEDTAVYQCQPDGVVAPLPAHPPPASTFLLQPAGWTPPAFIEAQSFLSEPSYAVGVHFVRPERQVPPLRYLFLGQGDSHMIHEISYGALIPQVVAAVGIRAPHLHATVQRDPFSCLCIQGQEISRCLSYRDVSGLPEGRKFTLFLDCRRLGLPVCSRIVPGLTFSLTELLQLVPVTPPEDFSVHIGGRFTGDEDALSFEDRDSVAIWFEPPVSSEAAPSSPATDGAEGRDQLSLSDGEGSEEDTVGHRGAGATRRGMSRSRSPPPTASGGHAHSCGDRGALEVSDAVARSDGGGPAVGGLVPEWDCMWNWGICDMTALCPCCPEDTSAACTVDASHQRDAGTHVGAVRPIPTPCRGRRELPSVGRLCDVAVADLEPLRRGNAGTLLSTAHRTPQFDHLVCMALAIGGKSFCAHSSEPCVPPPGQEANRRELLLAPCLEPPCFDLTRAYLPVGKTLDDVKCLLDAGMRMPWRQDMPADVEWHPQTAEALYRCSCAQTSHEGGWGGYHVFTDGSFDGIASAWCVVCVCVSMQQAQPVDVLWMSGPVCTDASHPTWLGALCHGAQEAELTAVCVALLWCLSLQGQAAFKLSSDSLVTVKRAGGLWKFDASNKLAHACRALAQATEAFGHAPWQEVEYVPAHSGVGWNEMADTLAKRELACGDGTRMVPLLREWIHDASIGHLWLLLAAHCHPHLWPTLQGAALSTSAEVIRPDLPPSAYFGPGRGPELCKSVVPWRQLSVVTMNVQTMEGGGLHDQEGRVGFLRSQMIGRGIHVVAVQEARTPKTASVLSEAYVRLCSGRSDSGQLGTELWFLRDTGTSDVAFRPEDLTVVAFTPRLIVVKVASPLWRGVIASIHAPTRGDQQREAWWVDLATTLSRIVGTWPLLLAGDWNTRFDCSRHLRVGGLLCDSKDQVPEGCLQILSRHDLWLPSTFLHVHTGPSDTWFSPGFAKPSRLDYIAVPTNWVVGEGASRTLPHVDLGHASLDHVAVQLDVWCPPRAAAVRPGGRPVHFDRLAMSTSEGQARLRDICSRAPDVEWCVDASTHFHTVQQG